MSKIQFMPGAFDDFVGSQEELDDLVEFLTELAEKGLLDETSEPLYFDMDDSDDEIEFELEDRILQ